MPATVTATAAARLVDVHKTYRAGTLEVVAVRGVTLEIDPGEFLSIAGPSGSGKTTLLNLVGALDTPTAGSVRIGDSTTSGLSPAALADFRNTHLGFVFQAFNLIPVLTARENVEFPLMLQGMASARERAARADAMLREVGLDGLGGRRPDELSGGQQQRVAIARALVKGPTLVLADEPTANLDSVTALEVMALMHEINQRLATTFVFSTHDPMVMDHATRLVMLRDGQIESDERRSARAPT
jgi:putative ABC transport system ATP-binding protein